MSTKVVYSHGFGGFDLTDEAITYIEDYCISHNIPFPWIEDINLHIPRHHPALVECVEILGEKAGERLDIIEIDEDRYWIREYDGDEIIYTPNTIDWIHVNDIDNDPNILNELEESNFNPEHSNYGVL